MTLSLRDYQSEAGIGKWVAAVGCTDAPTPRRGIRQALEYFSRTMPALPVTDAEAFLAAMDLSREVKVVTLRADERIIAFRSGSESPFKLFFAHRGASMHSSGINTGPRATVHFRVREPFQALECFTTGTRDTWTRPSPGQTIGFSPRAHKLFGPDRAFGPLVAGGGAQLIIPNSFNRLLVEG